MDAARRRARRWRCGAAAPRAGAGHDGARERRVVGRRAGGVAGARRCGAARARPIPTTTPTTTWSGGASCCDGMKPDFEAYAAPTEHPLFLALCALRRRSSGTDADRVLVLVCVLCARRAACGRPSASATRASGRWPGAGRRASSSGSSFAFLLYAARAYVDVPFLALVLWAAALEARAPRRGAAGHGVLAVAGLLRPEAWVLAGAYWLWCGWRRAATCSRSPSPRRWSGALVDLWVTGDPLLLAARHQRPRRRAQPQPRAVVGARARSCRS